VNPVFPDNLVRSRGTKDTVSKVLDLLMLHRNPKSFLGKDPVGQVFFLINAKLLHHFGLVLALWLGVKDDPASEGGKRDPQSLLALRRDLPSSTAFIADCILSSGVIVIIECLNEGNRAEFGWNCVVWNREGYRIRGREQIDPFVA